MAKLQSLDKHKFMKVVFSNEPELLNYIRREVPPDDTTAAFRVGTLKDAFLCRAQVACKARCP